VRIPVNGVELFVDVDGPEWVPDGDRMRRRPTLILLHGGPGLDHSSFKLELDSLREVAQLVYVDHRGNGRSARAMADTWNLAQWADDVRGLCDVLGIERPIVLGQSFGGFVAQVYAARHPGHPGGLIFSSTSGRFTAERNLAVFERLGGAAARSAAEAFYRDPTIETFKPFLKVCMPLYNTRFSDPGGLQRGFVNIDVLVHFFANEYRDCDLLPGLANIECPTLVLGGEDDPTTPIEDQVDVAAAVPEGLATFHRFSDCGHGAYRDCPDQALPILRSFIEHCHDEAEGA
jgi:proline iminopeptidase